MTSGTRARRCVWRIIPAHKLVDKRRIENRRIRESPRFLRDCKYCISVACAELDGSAIVLIVTPSWSPATFRSQNRQRDNPFFLSFTTDRRRLAVTCGCSYEGASHTTCGKASNVRLVADMQVSVCNRRRSSMMLVLYILVTIGIIIMVILFIFFIYMIIMLIDEHFEGKFDYNFVRTSFVMTVAVLLMLSGLHWYNESLINNGDVLNGLILMMIGGVIAIGLLSYTIWKTNLIYAILITSLQLGILPLTHRLLRGYGGAEN
ncbi:MAG: hypothetical protein RMJ48_07730 [Roseiflexaceae bacterium]|nr:hypothetical protein [Roseiflexaceae bacterium]